MKDICFINIFEGEEGGGEVYLNRLISGLDKTERYKITLMTPSCEGLLFENSRIESLPITGVKKTNALHNIFRFFKTIREINRYVRNKRFDFLIFNGERASYLSPFIYSSTRKIIIRHMLIGSKLKAFIATNSFRCSYRVVTISNYHKKNFISFLGESVAPQIEVIYNAVDLNNFPMVDFPPEQNQTVFIQIGSLEERKGILNTLRAFHRLLIHFPDAKLKIVGKGPLESVIKEFIKKNKLEKNIYLLGFRKDIQTLLSQSHVLLLPSFDEGLPLSILEAFSSGRPVISTKIAGIPEVVDSDSNGYLIEPGDEDALQEAMSVCCNNRLKIQEMGINARKKVEKIFRQEEWLSFWENLLSK